jgi:bile acid-coenzyme A ligase
MDDEISYGRQLTRLADQYGDEPAIVLARRDGTESSASWTELERRATQVAHLFAERGVVEGDLVVVALPNSIEHVMAAFAAWKAGGSVLPMRHDLPPWERDRLLALASARVVVADWDDAPPATISTTDLAATSDRPTTPLPDSVPKWSRVVASSGSTGRPKLIATPIPGVVGNTPLQTVSGENRQIMLGASPLYHTNGWQGGPGGMLEGHRSILMERFDAALAVDLIERHRVTISILVPTMLMRIARLPDIRTRDFSSIDRIVYGGASIPEWVVRVWFDLIGPEKFLFSYGSSEGIGIVMTTGDEWLKHPGTTGVPATCDLKIVDEHGNEVPAGTVGEIYMRSHEAGPPFEYVGAEMPPATADDFRSIGDMGWVDDDGFLYIADRRQDMIVTGGANVFPAEVEAALSEHPGVADSAVIGLPDEEWGHRVHAIVQPVGPDAAPSEDELRAFCKERLASYKVPKTFELVDALPRTSAGKINRGALAEERGATI